MVVLGGLSVLFGASLVPDEGTVTPDVDTEMRFFSVWYAAGGVALLSSMRRLESAGTTIRLIGAAFFVAGCARILSWIDVGSPHSLFLVLMVAELLLPLVIIPWHAAIARRSSSGGYATRR